MTTVEALMSVVWAYRSLVWGSPGAWLLMAVCLRFRYLNPQDWRRV
jgi:hypothetical protein